MCDMSQTSSQRYATMNFFTSSGNSILQTTRRGISSGNSLFQTTRTRLRSILKHTSSPPRPNEATSDADELSELRGRLQHETELLHTDMKPENVILGITHPRLKISSSSL